MGKVLHEFTNGWPGAVSRSVDDIIISLANASGGEIPFGAAVFLTSSGDGCKPFDPSSAASFSMDKFIGITVRSGDKTPNTFGSSKAVFNSGDSVEILTRGAIVLEFGQGVDPGDKVYIRKSDGAFVADAGTSGSTIELTNVRVKTPSDSENCAEVVVLDRNIL